MQDSLGNPIELGNRYGYSISRNGITDVYLGSVVKINEETGMASLLIERWRSGAGQKTMQDRTPLKKIIAFKSINLLPSSF